MELYKLWMGKASINILCRFVVFVFQHTSLTALQKRRGQLKLPTWKYQRIFAHFLHQLYFKNIYNIFEIHQICVYQTPKAHSWKWPALIVLQIVNADAFYYAILLIQDFNIQICPLGCECYITLGWMEHCRLFTKFEQE